MKDRIVEHPARYQLVPVTGTADQFDLVAVPGTVTEAGSAVNKANFLPDATAAALGLVPANDPQIKDALNTLARIVKIGAIVPYVGSSYSVPGQTWALCNGAKFTQDAYPDLFATSIGSINYALATLNLSGGTASSLFKLNGYYLAGGLSYQGYPCLWYSTTLTGAFTQKIIYDSANAAITRIKYLNGYYIAYAFGVSNFYWCNSLTGTWGRYTTGGSIYDATYNNGYWMFAVTDPTYHCIFSNNMTSFNSASVPNQLANPLSMAFYTNGTFTYVVYTNDQYEGGVSYCTSPSAWTYYMNSGIGSNNTLLDSGVFGTVSVMFTDRYFWYKTANNTNNYYHVGGIEITKYLGHAVYNNILYVHCIRNNYHCIAYCNATDISSITVWTFVNLDTTIQASSVFGFIYDGTEFNAGGGSASTYFYGTSFTVGNAKNLPTLTATGINYFIRML